MLLSEVIFLILQVNAASSQSRGVTAVSSLVPFFFFTLSLRYKMPSFDRNTTPKNEAMRTTFIERVTKTIYFTKMKELISGDSSRLLFVNDLLFSPLCGFLRKTRS